MPNPKTSTVKKKKTAVGKPAWKISPLPGETPTQYINSVAISADASLSVAGTFYHDYGIHVPAPATFFPAGVFAYNKHGVLQWKDQFSATEGVYWVACSRDAAWVAGGGLISHGVGFIRTYDGASGNIGLDYRPVARTNMVALDTTGNYLVAGAEALYLFKRTGNNWGPVPQKLAVAHGDVVIAVSISGDGKWIVAGTLKGVVMLVQNTAGVLGVPVTWQLPANGTVHWISLAEGGSCFAVAGSSASVYFFTIPGFMATKMPAWIKTLTGCRSCRSVAVSDDGSLVSAVANMGNAGKVFLLSNRGSTGRQKWAQRLLHNPNSTSIDAMGKYVTVADGYPDGSPGTFYLFGATGNKLMNYTTGDMSWPLQIAAGATAIAGGSDDSNVYYFKVP